MATGQSAGLTCPKCGAADVGVIGTEGSSARTLDQLFGPFSQVFVPAAGDTGRLQYRCHACHEKFLGGQPAPETADRLERACTIAFHRDSGFVGAMMPNVVYLNGERVGEVKNGKSIEFETRARSNVITVTDQNGVAFKDTYAFDAVDGGAVEVHFNRKFK